MHVTEINTLKKYFFPKGIIRLPHSRSKCNSGDFGRGFITQAFPGSVVNL